MENKISNISFQAKLSPNIVVKNPKRLENIAQIFAKRTGRFAQDSLYVSNYPETSLSGYHAYYIDPKAKEYILLHPVHVLDNMDKLMEKYSDNEIARKLVKMFKCLKAETAFDQKTNGIYQAISSIKANIRQNVLAYNRFLELGKSEHAKTCEALAKCNHKKIITLEQLQKSEQEKFVSYLNRITDKDPDLDGIVQIYQA